jgi:hypothetical protein
MSEGTVEGAQPQQKPASDAKGVSLPNWTHLA